MSGGSFASVLLPLMTLAGGGVGDAHQQCAGLAGRKADVVVESAIMVNPDPTYVFETSSFYRPVPVRAPFCRVQGKIEGNIGFEVWLPGKWNGRLLGAGVGGDAGQINYTDMSLRLGQGFASVSTDSGHTMEQAHWMLDPKARADYEHRAVHLSAVAAKSLAQRFYGRPVDRAYFTGCSGGGRQALKEMQKYPGDYDGVLAGAPGPYMPLQSVRMLWFSLEQLRQPEAALRDEDWALYENAVIRQCDRQDGVADGIVENPATCSFDPATLICRPGQYQGCISAPRLAMLTAIASPMRDPDGNIMDTGLFPGVRTRPGPPSPLLRAMWADGVHNDVNWDQMSFDPVADLAAANQVMPELRADNTAISPFIARGNKAIIYQGWQDPSTNAGPTINYFSALAKANGGLAKLSDSVRLFMVPGMYHCSGGPGVDLFGGSGHQPLANGSDPSRDMLWALIRWVEQGVAPASVTGAKNPPGVPGLTRLLCPFPKIARYDGQGPQDDASSYSCVDDTTLASMLDR